jgi:hypothetical protein
MDVFFNVDTTGSMDAVITSLQTALSSTVLPGIRAVVADTQFGVGAFEDFPVAPYGESSCSYGALGGPDQPFELFQAVTGDLTAVQTALNDLALAGNAIGCGNDSPESAIEAMYQIATGAGLTGPAPTLVPAATTGIGGAAFRPETLPVIVNFTDAVSHDADPSACGGVTYAGAVLAAAHGLAATMTAVRGICGRVVQISSSTVAACSSVSDGVAWNEATGAVVPPEAWDVGTRPAGCAPGQCCTGVSLAGVAPRAGVCPLTYLISAGGAGGGAAVTSAVELAARFAPMTVTGVVVGVGQDEAGGALPGGTTTADFVASLTPASHGTSPIPGFVPTLTATEFQRVIPGTDVGLTVELFNDFVVQGAELRLFTATVQVLADGCRVLDRRPVSIVVPPAPLS